MFYRIISFYLNSSFSLSSLLFISNYYPNEGNTFSTYFAACLVSMFYKFISGTFIAPASITTYSTASSWISTITSFYFYFCDYLIIYWLCCMYYAYPPNVILVTLFFYTFDGTFLSSLLFSIKEFASSLLLLRSVFLIDPFLFPKWLLF